jgi:hypothetical protein
VLMLSMIKEYTLKRHDFISTSSNFERGYVLSAPALLIRDEFRKDIGAPQEYFKKACEAFAKSIIYIRDLDRPLYQSEKRNLKSSLENILEIHDAINKKD